MRRTAAGLAATALIATACGAAAQRVVPHSVPRPTSTAAAKGLRVVAGGHPAGTRLPSPGSPRAVALMAFESCPALLDHVKTEALAEVTAYGLSLPGIGVAEPMRGGMARGGAAGADAAPAPASASGAPAPGGPSSAPAAGESAAGSSFSTTNVQEAGVDEPDLAKTDGRLLVTIRRQPAGVQIADVGETPRLRGFLAMTALDPSELFLVGANAVVLGPATDAVPSTGPTSSNAPYAPRTAVAVVSLADPDHPSVTRSFVVDGREVSARLVSGRIELVVQGGPRLVFSPPQASGAPSTAQAIAANKAVIRSSTVEQWLPAVTSRPSGQRRLADCGRSYGSTTPTGVGTVSVVSIDPQADTPAPPVTVVGDASTVYATTTSLYLASASWADQQRAARPDASGPDASGMMTQLHAFDLSDPAKPRYAGSGSVPGALTDQYALSEYAGALRVATTVGSATPAPGEGSSPTQLSDNRVTVFKLTGGALLPIGSVGGLGRGERIYGVRFVDKLAYVVTFRQIDPLAVVDLSDPLHPVVRGQLELTGFSAYLHPLGGGALLGVGEAVDGSACPTGLQLSLFDVSNPATPALRARLILDGASTTADNDHHAFLYWAPAHLVVIPVTEFSQGQPWSGVIGFRVSGGVTQVGRITHDRGSPQPQPQPQPERQPQGAAPGSTGGGSASPGGAPTGGGSASPAMPCRPGNGCGGFGSGIERAIVVGNLLYTTSDRGVLASHLDSLGDAAWLPYS